MLIETQCACVLKCLVLFARFLAHVPYRHVFYKKMCISIHALGDLSKELSLQVGITAFAEGPPS